MKQLCFILLLVLAAFCGLFAVVALTSDSTAMAALYGFLFFLFATNAKRLYGDISRNKRRHPKAPDMNTAASQAIALALTRGPDAALSALQVLPEVMNAQDRQQALGKTIQHSLPALVYKALEDKVLTEEEENAIVALLKKAHMTVDNLPAELRERLVKAALVRDLLNGCVSPRMTCENFPFNLQKKEILVWCWTNVEVLQDKTVSEWQGGSQGVSIPIARGIYYRVGGSRGHKVSREVRESLGVGPFAVTNRHVLFQGESRAVRIRLDNIISSRLYSDGITIWPDGANAKPLTILTDDAWFMMNCISNAQNWA